MQHMMVPRITDNLTSPSVSDSQASPPVYGNRSRQPDLSLPNLRARLHLQCPMPPLLQCSSISNSQTLKIYLPEWKKIAFLNIMSKKNCPFLHNSIRLGRGTFPSLNPACTLACRPQSLISYTPGF